MPLTIPDIPLPDSCLLSSEPQIITGIMKMEEENNKGEFLVLLSSVITINAAH